MKRLRILVAGGTLCILLAALLTGCNASFLSYGNDFPGHMELNYGYFHGDDISQVAAKRGQEITVKYEARVERGSLSLALQDPSGVTMWSKEFTSNSTDTVTLATDEAGQYSIVVTGHDTKGKYDVSWKVE